MTFIDLFKKECERTQQPQDWALYHAFKKCDKAVLETLEYCDTFYQFHKSFRQIDVTNSAHIDMIIWELVSMSDIVQTVFEKAKSEKL